MSGKTRRTKRLLLDSGAVDRLARGDEQALADFKQLKSEHYWPPVVHTVVLVECLSGNQRKDARVNRFLKSCQVLEEIPERIARRAGGLRTKTKRGFVVDSLLVAMAESGGVVLTEDLKDIEALASNAHDVTVESSKPGKR